MKTIKELEFLTPNEFFNETGCIVGHDPLRVLTADWIHGECSRVHLGEVELDSKGHLHLKSSAAAALGKLGGSAKSEQKTAACRENASKPRPNARGKKKPRKVKEPV